MQETFVQKMTKVVNDSPWVVALVVVIVGLPISIILYMLCSSSPPKKVNFASFTFLIIKANQSNITREQTPKRLMHQPPTMFQKRKKKQHQPVQRASWTWTSQKWKLKRMRQPAAKMLTTKSRKRLNKKRPPSDHRASRLLESASLERSNSKEKEKRSVGECFVHKAKQSTHH